MLVFKRYVLPNFGQKVLQPSAQVAFLHLRCVRPEEFRMVTKSLEIPRGPNVFADVVPLILPSRTDLVDNHF